MTKRERFGEDRRRAVFDRTRGRCHICGKKLCFSNYGCRDGRAGWHVDHSVPIAAGGSNHGNNLLAACIACNQDKSTYTSRTARRWNGRSRAPLSPSRYQQKKAENAIGVGAIGAGIGALIGGPPGALIGGLLGAALGHDEDPDE
jgi:5-methylcytosine-specific restriction endonuclease McrA